MSELTLAEIAGAIGLITAMLAGMGAMRKHLSTVLTKFFASEFEKIDQRFKHIEEKDKKTRCEMRKNYLVQCLATIQRGDTLSEIEQQRMFEVYEAYVRSGHNGYIKHMFEELQKNGLLSSRITDENPKA